MNWHGCRHPLTIALLIQSVVILGGTLVTIGMLKFSGYPDADHVIWNPVAEGVRNWGWLAIMIPRIWLGVSIRRGVDSADMASAILASIGVLLFLGFYYWTATTAATPYWSGSSG
jgi:hypothetical protein